MGNLMSKKLYIAYVLIGLVVIVISFSLFEYFFHSKISQRYLSEYSGLSAILVNYIILLLMARGETIKKEGIYLCVFKGIMLLLFSWVFMRLLGLLL